MIYRFLLIIMVCICSTANYAFVEKSTQFNLIGDREIPDFPLKYDSAGNVVAMKTQLPEAFSDLKLQQRRACNRASSSNLNKIEVDLFSKIDRENDPRFFFTQNFRYRNLYDIERNDLTAATLKDLPWPGDYWPYSRGLLGNRFTDPNFRALWDWKDRFDYIKANPAQQIYSTGDLQKISQLSVSEKYDLLAGGADFPITESMWQQGQRIYDKEGQVDDWMGLCHGWAAAAIASSKPHKSIHVKSFDSQQSLTFYPDELKALSTYTWANAKYPTHFAGRRCQDKDPTVDENGRIIDPKCLDLNPATWHIAVVNQIGDLGESFVMDSTYDFEVWNFPVFSYQYSYINLLTGKDHSSLDSAKVAVADFTSDSFKAYRSEGTKYIVGIQSSVGIIVETDARQAEGELPQRSYIRYIRYFYDLELDENGMILGGEWRQKAHPDFIWKPAKDASANTPFDQFADKSTLSLNKALNKDWQYLVNVSSKFGLILNTLVEYFVEQSEE